MLLLFPHRESQFQYKKVGTCSYGLFDTSVTCEAESRWSLSMVTTAVMETKVHAKEKKGK